MSRLANLIFIILILSSCNRSSDDFSDYTISSNKNSFTLLWPGTKQLGTSSYDNATEVATDSSGNVYVGGGTGAGLDGNSSAGNSDFFVVKYDSDGNKL